MITQLVLQRMHRSLPTTVHTLCTSWDSAQRRLILPDTLGRCTETVNTSRETGGQGTGIEIQKPALSAQDGLLTSKATCIIIIIIKILTIPEIPK